MCIVINLYHTCTYIYIYMRVHICMYIYIYICIYTCIQYTYMYLLIRKYCIYVSTYIIITRTQEFEEAFGIPQTTGISTLKWQNKLIKTVNRSSSLMHDRHLCVWRANKHVADLK